MKGGKRPGAGKPKGAKNKRTKERLKTIQKVTELVLNAFPGDAHALMVAVYKDQMNDLYVRLDAAKAAIPYEKPRLSSIEHVGRDRGPIEMLLAEIDGTTRGLPNAKI